jgi:hypothetical protein
MEFWAWWAQHSADPIDKLTQELPAQVRAIHPELVCEIGPGLTAEHVLCLTGDGDPELRAITERWVRGAPPADDKWEFAPARRADPHVLTTRLEIDEWQLDLADTVVSLRLDEERAMVMVHMHHPELASVPDWFRDNFAGSVLTWTLGEDDDERWIDGAVVALERPDDALPLEALREVVASLAARTAGPKWAKIEGETCEGLPMTGEAIWPMRWIDHPTFDRHLGVDLGFAGELDGVTQLVLEQLQDEVAAALEGQEVLLVAIETVAGLRTLHYYCDSTNDEPAEVIQRWVRGHASRRLRVEFDPGWWEVSLLR